VDREVTSELAARLAQDEAHAFVEAEALRGEIELLLRDFPRVDPRSNVLGGHGMDVLTCLAVIDRLDLGRLPDDPTGRAVCRREVRIDATRDSNSV
jgi:hypothetical protein